MSSCISPSSLMLTRGGASSVDSQHLTSSHRCFYPKPHFRTFSLVSKTKLRDPSNWVTVNLHREALPRSHHAFVAACSLESDMAETAEDAKEKEEDGVRIEERISAVPRPKIKTWKGTLFPGGQRIMLFSVKYQDRGLLPHQVRRRSFVRIVGIPSLSRGHNKEYNLKTAISLLKQTAPAKIEAIFS